MKHLKTTEQGAQQKETYQLLQEIKEMINSPLLREEGFRKLLEIDADTLTVSDQVFYYYIKGKYYVLTFKDSQDKDLELLAYGNDCYTDMVAIAYDNDIPIKNPKRHFARAYCKYLIAINQTSEEVKKKLFQKVKQISGRVLCYQPDNASFLWIESKLKS